LQKWFAATAHPAAKDPYFLYGASNLGSMLAPLAYPAVVEPNLRLAQQSFDWTVGYGVLVALTAACAAFLWLSPPVAEKTADKAADAPAPPPEAAEETAHHTLTGEVTWKRVLRWVALGFVPSSLMLGATTYITTDIAAIPLLWVLPLALYLLSFIIVFSRVPAWVHRTMVRLMPPLVLLLLFLTLSNVVRLSVLWNVVLHLATLFVVAMVCHGELARDRPAPRYLTGFYLWMSVGGVAGGLFNALLAPVAFSAIVEYPLALVLACLLMPAPGRATSQPEAGPTGLRRALLCAGAGGFLIWLRVRDHDLPYHLLSVGPWQWGLAALALGAWVGLVHVVYGRGGRLDRWLDLLAPVCLAALVVGVLWGLWSDVLWWRTRWAAEQFHLTQQQLRIFLAAVVALGLCYTFARRPLRFGLALGAVLLAFGFCGLLESSTLYQERSFFGVHKVENERQVWGGQPYLFRRLMHGTTVHGKQHWDEPLRDVPTAYYHPSGPMGQLMEACNPDGRRKLAVIGLGAGTMACFAHPGQHITFFEIDPVVRRLAFDEGDAYFTFVRDARRRGAHVDLVMGDGRLTMERQQLSEAEKYGFILADAFSSDAIPVHLITREAVQVYLDKLTEDGVIVFNVSNRHIDLRPMLANLAREQGLAALWVSDDAAQFPGKAPSTWVVLARKDEHLEPLRALNERDRRREQVRNALAPLAGWPDNGTGPAGHAFFLRTMLNQDVCKRRYAWREMKPAEGEKWPDPARVGVWTDDYSNLLGVLKW
jgi:spermidine synthase